MAAVPAVNITIDSGTNFEATFTITSEIGSVIDLTGYTAVSKIRKYPTSTSYKNFVVGITSSTGRITLSMASTITTDLVEGRNYYDIVITSPNNVVSKVIEGMALVSPTVSE